MIEKAIFRNPVRAEQVKDTHKGLRNTFRNLTLEEVLTVGYNWERAKIEQLKADGTLDKLIFFFYGWDYDKSTEQLSSFKLYNQPAITRHAKYRARFMRLARSMGYELDKFIPVEKLEMLSFLGADSNSVLYALKCYALGNYDLEDQNRYMGLQPQTGPVHNANRLLFGKDLTVREHTDKCREIGTTISRSPMFVNTAFYFMG